MSDCIFCKIIEGSIPSYKLYEDDFFIAILDRYPSSMGHTLIITKKHFDDVYSIDDEYSNRLFSIVAKLSKAVRQATDCDGINIIQNNGTVAGQSIRHFHVHIIPRFENDEIRLPMPQLDPSHEDLTAIAEKIRNGGL